MIRSDYDRVSRRVCHEIQLLLQRAGRRDVALGILISTGADRVHRLRRLDYRLFSLYHSHRFVLLFKPSTETIPRTKRMNRGINPGLTHSTRLESGRLTQSSTRAILASVVRPRNCDSSALVGTRRKRRGGRDDAAPSGTCVGHPVRISPVQSSPLFRTCQGRRPGTYRMNWA